LLAALPDRQRRAALDFTIERLKCAEQYGYESDVIDMLESASQVASIPPARKPGDLPEPPPNMSSKMIPAGHKFA
jgi:hypothetical protein